MKKILFFFLTVCAVQLSFAQTYVNLCQGSDYEWILDADSTDTIVYFTSSADAYSYNNNRIYDTIVGNTLNLSPNIDTIYRLVSVNGQVPTCPNMIVFTMIPSPTFTVDSIHHVTCPDPYVHGNNPIPPGPWADGGFSVILNDSVQNYEYIRILNSSNIIMEEFHDSFTTGGLCGGTYNIIARGTNGCEVTQQVTIQQPPAWGISINWNKWIYCNTMGTIELNVSGGTPPYNYDWHYYGPSMINLPDTSKLTNLDVGIYQVFITDANNCLFYNQELGIKDTIQRIATDTVHLNYYTPEDSVTLIECPESMEVCQYKPFFNALSLGHGEYLWSTGNITQNETGPYQTGWLNVEFTDQNGCVTRDSVYLDVYDANISITADSIMNDDSVYTVTVSPLGGTLYLDGIEIPIENGTISFDASQYQLGEHDLSYVGEWGAFGCYFDTTFQFIIQHQDGVSEFERNTKLWPNPTSNVLNIEFSGEFSGDILLFDMTGRLLKTSEKESEITSIDVSDLTSGVYFIHFVSESGCFTKKFVKK